MKKLSLAEFENTFNSIDQNLCNNQGCHGSVDFNGNIKVYPYGCSYNYTSSESSTVYNFNIVHPESFDLEEDENMEFNDIIEMSFDHVSDNIENVYNEYIKSLNEIMANRNKPLSISDIKDATHRNKLLGASLEELMELYLQF